MRHLLPPLLVLLGLQLGHSGLVVGLVVREVEK